MSRPGRFGPFLEERPRYSLRDRITDRLAEGVSDLCIANKRVFRLSLPFVIHFVSGSLLALGDSSLSMHATSSIIRPSSALLIPHVAERLESGGLIIS